MGWRATGVLILLGLLAYVNAIAHPFVHDDIVFIAQNPQIAHLDRWVDAFLPSAWFPGSIINTYYRPLLEIFYRLEYQIFGLNPHGYHVMNVLVHVANGVLVGSLLIRLGLARHLAWAVAMLFLVHPVQTEAVSCVAGISNLLMAMLVLGALHAYLSRWILLAGIIFFSALLVKEQGLIFVPLAALVTYHRRDKTWGHWVLMAGIAVMALGLRQQVTGVSLLNHVLASPGELYLRVAAIARVLLTDLRLIIAPFDLHYYRCTDILRPNVLAWVGLAVLGVIVFLTARRNPSWCSWFVLGVGWFLGALMPVLNIVPLINEFSLISTAEHFLYLPLIGFLVIAVVVLDVVLKEHRRWVLTLVVACFLGITWHQNTFWRNEVALFERTVRFEREFARAHMLLAKAYYFDGQPQQAQAHYAKAFDVMSAYERKVVSAGAKGFYLGQMKGILFEWAQCDSARGQWASALDKYTQALRIDPSDAVLYNNIAFVYLNLGDIEQSRAFKNKAAMLDLRFKD